MQCHSGNKIDAAFSSHLAPHDIQLARIRRGYQIKTYDRLAWRRGYILVCVLIKALCEVHLKRVRLR